MNPFSRARGGYGAMENPETAQIFDEVADLLEIQGANPVCVSPGHPGRRPRSPSDTRVAAIRPQPLHRTVLTSPSMGHDLLPHGPKLVCQAEPIHRTRARISLAPRTPQR